MLKFWKAEKKLPTGSLHKNGQNTIVNKGNKIIKKINGKNFLLFLFLLLRISKKEIKIINNGIKIPKILEPMAKPDVKEKKIEYLTFFFLKI